MTGKVTVPDIRARKRSRGAGPIVMITAYDAPFARVVDRADVDIILVGIVSLSWSSAWRTLSRSESRISPTTLEPWHARDRELCS